MKKINLKTIICILLILVLIPVCIILISCMKKDKPSETAEEIPETAAGTDVITDNTTDNEVEVIDEDVNNTEDPDENMIPDDHPIDSLHEYYSVTYVPDDDFSIVEKEQVFLTDAEQPILSCKYSYPTINDHYYPDAREAINRYMEDAMNEFFAEMEKKADEDEKYFIESDEEWSYHWELIHDRIIRCARTDAEIVSFYIEDNTYDGGVTMNQSSSALNFDSKTGELLQFKDICTDGEQLIQTCTDYVLQRDFLWGMNAEEDIPDLIRNIIDRGSWYFLQEGFVLSSDKYEFGGGSDGCVQIVIPYDTLYGNGLNSAYSYFGNSSGVFVTAYSDKAGTKASVDLYNEGDHEDDVIYVEQAFDPADAMTGNYKILINDIDVSKVLEPYEISRSWTDHNWYIKDIDCMDAYMEIFLRLDETTLILRYDDDSLTVLGELEGIPSLYDLHAYGDGTVTCCGNKYSLEDDHLTQIQ